MARKKTRKARVEPKSARSDAQSRTATGHSASDPVTSIERALTVAMVALILVTPLVPDSSSNEFFGWPVLILWWLSAIGLAIRYLLIGNATIRWSPMDLCLYGVCLWAVLSGWITIWTESGHARATINASWIWIQYGIAYFVLRQLLAYDSLRRITIVAGWSIAVGCAAGGLYQRMVILPSMHAEYRNLPEEQKLRSLKTGGVNNREPGSRERMMWESRFFSSEPTSTFVLANSLAAFLTPWLLLSYIFLLPSLQMSKGRIAYWGLGLLLILVCLLLTKSRTAYVATVAGAILIAAAQFLPARKERVGRGFWVLVFGGCAVVGILVVLAAVSGLLDVEILSEAPKSILYRWEYWQASGELIRDHLWFGSGPGNFQHLYGKYQLVQASETVAEPHNFLVEVWAVAGTPAALMMIFGGGLWILQLRHLFAKPGTLDPSSSQRRHADEPWLEKDQRGSIPLILIGGFLALGMAMFIGFVNDFGTSMILVSGTVGVVAAAAGFALLPPSIPSRPVALATVAYVIGLSASGGIGFPSVALTGLLLIAWVANAMPTRKRLTVGRPAIGILLFALAGSLFLFRASVVVPMLNAKKMSRAAENALLSPSSDPGRSAIDYLQKAIEADPYDGNYRFFLTEGRLMQFRQQPAQEVLDELIRAARKSVAVRPNNAKVALETGKIFLSIVQDPPPNMQNELASIAKKEAVRMLTLATRRRPNDAEIAAYLALAHRLAGNRDASDEWTDRALELDRRNPHPDRDLQNGPYRARQWSSKGSIEQQLLENRKK